MVWNRCVSLLLALSLALAASAPSARPGEPPALGEVAAADLPAQARQTLDRIRSGGPFPYEKDGAVFGNRERSLPQRKRGYYREYTVPTPGARDRGGRRIVAGSGPARDVRTSGEYYYSDNHYNSFRRIRK